MSDLTTLPESIWIVKWQVRNPGYWQQKGVQTKVYISKKAALASYSYHLNGRCDNVAIFSTANRLDWMEGAE